MKREASERRGEGGRGFPAAAPAKEPAMHDFSFRRIAPDESRIHVDGDDHVGNVYAMSDPSAAGGRVYIIHLDEDYRGPTRVHDRTKVRQTTARMIDTHPLWS